MGKMYSQKEFSAATLDGTRKTSAWRVNECLFRNKSACIFEGESDVVFYKPLIDEGSLKSRKCFFGCGKNDVIKGVKYYKKALEEQGPLGIDLFFCVDRDFDKLLDKKVAQEDCLFYQIWDCKNEKSKKCYNDLECFVVDSPIFNHVLTTEYGLAKNKVDLIRKEIIAAASFCGAIRCAVRKCQAEKKMGYPIFFEPKDGDFLNQKNDNKKEFSTEFLFEQGIISLKDGKIQIDESKTLSNLYIRYADEPNLECVKDYIEGVVGAPGFPGIDFCRGHDLMFFLHRFLAAAGKDVAPVESEEFQRPFYSISDVIGSARQTLLDMLSEIPLAKIFSSRLVEKMRLAD